MTDYFWKALEDHGEDAALVSEGDVVVTYLELARLADDFAARLPSGSQLVALQACNAIEAVAAYLGCLRHGHPVILLSPESLEDGRIVSIYQPNFLYIFEDGGWRLDHLSAEAAACTEELAVLLSTSGTTGAPKLVKLSRENIDSNARAIVEYLGLSPEERAITTLNFYYSYGMAVLNSHLAAGARIVLTKESLVSDGFWDLFRASEATSLALVPYQFEFLDRIDFESMDLPSLRYITQAGGRLGADKIRSYAGLLKRRGAELFVMYGQTEASPRISYIPPADLLDNMDAIGRPVPGGEIILLSEDGKEITDTGAVGELVYRGPNVMLGYALEREDLKAPRETTELRTGDIALRKPNGYFRIVGRMKRFIKLYGLRINLDDVEVFLTGCGHKVYCSGTDDLLVLFHVGAIDKESIAASLIEKYHIQGMHMTFRRLPEIPLMASGKVDYRRLKEISESIEVGGAGAGSLNGGTLDAVREIFGGKTVTPQDSFVTLGGDSLSFLSMSLFLEKRLGYLPKNWERLTVEEIEALEPSHSRFMEVPVDAVLRVIAILFVMTSHIYVGNFFLFVGGANVLMILAGLSMARYHGEKLKHASPVALAKSILGRVLIVYYVVMLSYFAINWSTQSGYFSRWFLLSANLYDFTTELYPYWFISAYAHIVLGVILFWRLPFVRRWLGGKEEWFGYGLLATGLVAAGWMKAHHPTPALFLCNTLSQVHLFALGWCIHYASDMRTKLFLLGVSAFAAIAFWMGIPVGHNERVIFIIGGTLVLLSMNGVSMPRKVGKLFVWLAAISFYLYIVHLLPGFYAQYIPTGNSFLKSGLVWAAAVLISVLMGGAIGRFMPAIERWIRSRLKSVGEVVVGLRSFQQ